MSNSAMLDRAIEHLKQAVTDQESMIEIINIVKQENTELKAEIERLKAYSKPDIEQYQVITISNKMLVNLMQYSTLKEALDHFNNSKTPCKIHKQKLILSHVLPLKEEDYSVKAGGEA